MQKEKPARAMTRSARGSTSASTAKLARRRAISRDLSRGAPSIPFPPEEYARRGLLLSMRSARWRAEADSHRCRFRAVPAAHRERNASVDLILSPSKDEVAAMASVEGPRYPNGGGNDSALPLARR